MIVSTPRRALRAPALLAGLMVIGAVAAAPAQERVPIRAASLTLPVFNPIIVNLIKERGLDAKHGLDLEIKPYPSIAAFYAALATGEVDTAVGGPTVFQKMRNEGVPLRIVATGIRLSDLVIVTADPAIRSLVDLRGKTLAADMGSQQYQIVAICGRAKGLVLGTDVTVVQASFALARTQLQAKRVDAALVIEPIATLMMRDTPQYRIIFNGGPAWRELTGADGWELVVAMRDEFTRRYPAAVSRYIQTLQDVQAFIRTSLDEADQIVVRTVKLPPGVFREAVTSGRWDVEVLPAWGSERRVIWDMFERAVAAKYLDRLPDDAIIYAP
jgi:NitT/TauT family transport system substrate-binding protein